METPKRVKYIYIKKNRLKNSKGIEFSQRFFEPQSNICIIIITKEKLYEYFNYYGSS